MIKNNNPSNKVSLIKLRDLLSLAGRIMRFICLILFVGIGSIILGQRKPMKIVFDAKISSVEEMGKKINVATVYLSKNGKLIDSTVTQNGRCFFEMDTGYVYKIEFTKHDYISKYLIVETTEMPKDYKSKSRIKVNVGLFRIRKKLDMNFLKKKPIGIASYNDTENKIAWNHAYTAKIVEEIVDATLIFTSEKEKGKREAF